MYKRMKKRFAYCAVLCILLSLVVNSTLAYFTAEDTARNVITSGAVSVEVVEKQLVGGTLENYPDTPVSIMPGSAVSKIVSVKNLDEPAWVRMTYTVTIRDASGNVIELSAQQRDQIITIDTDPANWTYKSGWWYCKKALATGEESKPLFTEVTFSGSEMGNAYQNCTVMIDVTAQAVQKAHNGNTVMDAAGWPVG